MIQLFNLLSKQTGATSRDTRPPKKGHFELQIEQKVEMKYISSIYTTVAVYVTT